MTTWATTKEGYIFDAWYVEGGNSFDFASAITADIKLVAKWKDPNKEYCTVTFKESDGKESTQSVVKGEKATKPTTDPKKDGYTFLGWYNGDTVFDFSTPITNNIALTAKWEQITSSGDEEGDKKPDGGEDNPAFGIDPSKPSEPLATPPDPIINSAANGPIITKASAGELETAYITWTAADNAKWYNVYVRSDAGEWTQLDGPLVREYKDYFRADALGLAAGTYDMKVVPVSGEDKEATEYASEATGITVYAHERAGYAFVNGTSSGAYNEDGTLKKDAVVLYVTNDNYDKITLQTGKGLMTGIDNILGEGYQSKKGDTKPLCVRIVGSIGTGSKLGFKAGGDLELKGLDQGVTIEGVGNDATANGWGLHITSSSNVEVRNLAFMEMQGTTKDGVSIESKCHHIWVHNCDFFYGHNWGGDQKKGDGSLDTKGSTNITHSYNHFWDSGKCNLQGMEKAEDTGIYQITYHHNWYDHSDSRHPRIRRATVHIYNNYFDGNAKYGVGVTNGASAFVENNYFRSTAKMKPMLSSMQGTDIAHGKDGQTFSGENGGMIKALGNKFDGTYELLTQNDTDANNLDCYMASSRTEQVPSSYTTKQGGTTYNNFDTAADMYEYSVDTAEQAKEKVERYAGRLDGGDLTYKFDNATQDKNYDIIPELSQLIQNYSKTLTLVKIGGGTASTTPGGNTGTGNEGGNEGGTEGGDDTTTVGFVAVGSYGFSTSATGFTKDKIFGSSGTAALTKLSAYGFTKTCQINSGGLVLKTPVETYGSLTFTLDKTLKLTFTDGKSKGVIISTDDGYVGSEGIKTSQSLTSANKLELGPGTYVIAGATSSGTGIASFAFEE